MGSMSITAPSPTSSNYDVDPQVVAEAIVLRLLAGRAFVAPRALHPA